MASDEILYHETIDGFKLLIKKVYLFDRPEKEYYLAYIRLPSEHKYYGIPHNEIPLNVHYKLSYGAEVSPITMEKDENGGYWLGWDYHHTKKPNDGKNFNDVLLELHMALNQLKDLENS